MSGVDEEDQEEGERRRWPIWASVLSSLASALLAGGVSITVSQRARESDRRAQEVAAAERARASAEALRIFCQMVIAQEEVFRPSESQIGRNAATAWHDLGKIIGCYKE